MNNLFTSAVSRFLEGHCTLDQVRTIEAEGSASMLWRHIEEAGFANVLLKESQGGAELTLTDIYPLMSLCGEHLVPVPLAETMLARGLLSEADIELPSGSIAFGSDLLLSDGAVTCDRAYNAANADWLLAARDAQLYLLNISEGTSVPSGVCLDRRIQWPANALKAVALSRCVEVRVLQACAASAQLAGAMQRVFSRTLAYANDRQQFGRSIGKFQAIQHQLALMAEHVFAATMAAQVGCHSSTWFPERLAVAVAKARTSEAAMEVAALSHSIHGAIGFTSEFDLQLFTRRLYAWRLTAGSESYWHDVAGEALCAGEGPVLDLVRCTTDF